jgi:histidinol dehydrogenase
VRKASEKQVQWIVRLVENTGRTATPDFIEKLRGLSSDQIRVVTARAQSAHSYYHAKNKKRAGRNKGLADARRRENVSAPQKSDEEIRRGVLYALSLDYSDSSPF